MKENNTIMRIAFDGTMTVLAEYDGKFSAEYALYLWWCQQYRHCDYNNICNHYGNKRQCTLQNRMCRMRL